MAAALFTFDVERSNALVRAQRRLGRITGAIENDLGEALAELLEEQTRRRILTEKTAPDGRAWEAWKPEYARTRKSGNSLLVDSHDLEKSVKGSSSGKNVNVLADTIYAAVHQYGHHFAHNGARVPARPYLGISAQNEIEIADRVREVLEEAIDELGSAHTKHGRAIRATPGRIV